VPQAQKYSDALEYMLELIADNQRLGTKIDYADNYLRFHHGRHVIV